MSSTFQDQLQAALGTIYILERELGGGGMSRVYLARETALGRKVVVKVLLPELAAGVNVERFRREIQLAAQLQHPHIVPLLAAGDADHLPYLIMPFVSGESLRARITREGELPIAESVRILRDVVSALGYAHANGVIHRDDKPDNVLLSGGVAVVTDFGVAKAVTASADIGATGLTSLGVALGTPAYMAPEQATASPQTDHRADLYALGVMAYELLTGSPPFAGRPPQAVLAAHVIEDPEPVERRRAAVPPLLAGLVRDCLAKRPADRPQSAAQVMHVLDAIATPSGGTAATTAVRMPAVMPAPTSRRRWMLAGTAVALAAFVALGIFLRRESPVRPVTAPPPDSTVATPLPPVQEEVAAAPSVPAAPVPAAKLPKPKFSRPAARRARTAALAGAEVAADTLRQPEPLPMTTAVESVAAETAAALAETPRSEPPAPVASTPSAPAPPAKPADLQQELQRLVAQYAAAIEARNLPAIQRLYPGMTPVQERGWQQFFQLVRDIRADLDITRLEVANGATEAQVAGTYSYLNTSSGRPERQPVSFHATFHRDGGQWRIVQVR